MHLVGETKEDHQNDNMSSVSKEEPVNPQFEEEPVCMQSSALQMAPDLAEDNVPLINHCAEESQKTCDNMMNQEETADEAEPTQNCTELQDLNNKLQKATTERDNL